MHEHNFYWLSLVPGLEEVNHPVVMAAVIALILIGATAIARAQLTRAMAREDQGLVPDEKLTYKNFFEIIAESLFGLTENVIGHHDAPIYFPVIGTLFVFIFSSNLIGLIPGVLPAHGNLNTTLALGAFVFIYYNFAGRARARNGLLQALLGAHFVASSPHAHY